MCECVVAHTLQFSRWNYTGTSKKSNQTTIITSHIHGEWKRSDHQNMEHSHNAKFKSMQNIAIKWINSSLNALTNDKDLKHKNAIHNLIPPICLHVCVWARQWFFSLCYSSIVSSCKCAQTTRLFLWWTHVSNRNMNMNIISARAGAPRYVAHMELELTHEKTRYCYKEFV